MAECKHELEFAGSGDFFGRNTASILFRCKKCDKRYVEY